MNSEKLEVSFLTSILEKNTVHEKGNQNLCCTEREETNFFLVSFTLGILMN